MKILGSSRILMPVVILLTAGWGCSIPIPTETTRPPISTAAGLFASIGRPPPALLCTLEILVEPERFETPDRFDTAGNLVDLGGDDTETIELRAIISSPLLIDSVRERVWSLDGVAVGQEETIAVDITLGEHAIGLDAECVLVPDEGTEFTVRGQAGARITLVGPTTPTALFRLDVPSFIDGVLVDDNTFRAVRPDGIVHVVLDGTPSSGGLESTIVRYVWGVDGAVIAFGPVAIAALPIGEHSIQLFVENSAGETHLSQLTGLRIVGLLQILP